MTEDRNAQTLIPPRALERLTAGVHLVLQAHFSNDFLSGPSFVEMHLNEEVLREHLRRRGICEAERLNMLEVSQRPLDYDQAGSDVVIKGWVLRIDRTSFWWKSEGDAAGSCTTPFLDFKDLIEALDYSGNDNELEGELSWYGGALVHCPGSLDDFIPVLEERRPALAARETELQMSSTIEQHKANDERPSSEATPTRRQLKL